MGSTSTKEINDKVDHSLPPPVAMNKVSPGVCHGGDHSKKLSAIAKQEFGESLQNLQDIAQQISEIQYQDYEYPFENIVFEGGGVKGQVYCGCLQVLEEVGIKPKRYAGASAGAIASSLAAIGYNSEELSSILKQDLSVVLFDHSCGICSLLPNLIRNFGWNPGKRAFEYMGDLIYAKTGDRDITFRQVYDRYGVELCITAVNLSMISVEYFHPKTTPHCPIRLAVRMSVGIPGIFEAVKFKNSQGNSDIYIDGGLLCNYPIYAFDGWWLSMDPKDSFLNKVQPLSQIHRLMDRKARFGTFNEKTLGFLVYSNLEQEVMQTELEARVGLAIDKRPDTKLYRSRAKLLQSKKHALEEHQVFLSALDKFMALLQSINNEKRSQVDDDNSLLNKTNAMQISGELDDFIDKAELEAALKRVEETPLDDDIGDDLNKGHLEILFGSRTSTDEIFKELDRDNSGKISFSELMGFIERSGIDIQSRFQGYSRKELLNASDFAVSLQDCLLTNVKKNFLEDHDFDRTVGVNTDYIETTDFKIEDEDHYFMVERGVKATQSFLKHYVSKNNPPKKVDVRKKATDNKPTPVPILEQPTAQSSSLDDHVEELMRAERSVHKLPPIRGQPVTPAPAVVSTSPTGTEETTLDESNGKDKRT